MDKKGKRGINIRFKADRSLDAVLSTNKPNPAVPSTFNLVRKVKKIPEPFSVNKEKLVHKRIEFISCHRPDYTIDKDYVYPPNQEKVAWADESPFWKKLKLDFNSYEQSLLREYMYGPA